MKDTNTVSSYKNFDPTEHADLLFGVGSATSAGPCLPSGSIHPSPETLEKDTGGYLRNQPIIGFGNAYISGSGGKKCYGNFLLCPTVGDIFPEHKKRACFSKPSSEKARCYEYSVAFENGISAKFSPTHNSAIYVFEFPEDGDGALFIDVAHKLDIDACLKNGFVTIDPKNKSVFGGGLCYGNWNDVDWNMYFALEFDSDFTEIGTMIEKDIQKIPDDSPFTASIDSEKRLGAYIKFGKCHSRKTVKVKIAISLESVEKAKNFLACQIPDFDYEKVKESAKNIWRKTLGAIELSSADNALLRRFYTALYHMNIQPRNRCSDHGKWDDFHTVWDTWKTVFPMYTLLYPEKMGAIIESFIDRAKENEAAGNGIVVSDAFLASNEFLAGQGGNDVDNVIADAIVKKLPLKRYTHEDAFSVLMSSAEKMRSPEYISLGFATDNKKTVTGKEYSWRFKPAAATMGFAFNDKACANAAKALGHMSEYEKYEKRSKNRLNVWNINAQSEGFFGFPQSLNEKGEFDDGFDPHGGYNTHFYEATAWDAAYINYNDVKGLVESMGGKDEFTRRLVWACEHSVNYFNDDDGKEGYLNFTNEPSFQIPWLFCTDEIRRPDLAAKAIDKIIERFSLPNDYPGDEDNGGMSSYYIFLMCGFFPFATTENYYLHGTRVEKIVFRLGNGKDFTVTGENVAPNNIYVQAATWQGKPLNVCKLTHEQLIEGGELHFVMGDKPSAWATE